MDLPGVRDANAARARIAQNYLQNCHRIWVVAPIKRAVDDGTAKELLGENFKRQLLMDGQYGNVTFICSQTDDCETTEIMRDHEDVARKVEGRWERMVELRDEITDIVTKRNESAQQREDLTAELEEIQGEAEALTDELGQADTGRGKSLPQLKASLQAKKQEANVILTKLEAMKQGNLFQKLEDRSASLQRELKSMAALVRNEYSTKCLQDDFRAGLEELTCRPEEEEGLDIETTREGNIPSPLTEDFQLDVHCIASNDYLKLQGVKLASDGTSNTFDEANDTGIPSLRAAVHSTTAEHRASSAAIFVKTASSILERFILCSTENIEENASTYLYRQVFEKEIEILRSKIGPVAAEFTSKAQAKFSAALHPSLKNGAEKGTAAAMATVKSWWATCRRTKQKRSPKQNALHWATYNAVVRRDGFYVSPTFGEVDFNQELCDPMEKEFSIDWQRDMDGAVKVFLAESEQQVVQISIELAKNVAGALVEAGMDPKRVEALAATADQNCATAIQAAFQNVFQLACNSQRNLNRSLLPKIRGQMSPGYSAAVTVPGGKGKFQRMIGAVAGHTNTAIETMFDEATVELQRSIDDFILQIASKIHNMAEVINNSLDSIYLLSSHKKWVVLDPFMQKQIQDCRNQVLPELLQLKEGQNKAMTFLELEHKMPGKETGIMDTMSFEKDFQVD